MAAEKIWQENFSVLTFHMDPQGKAHLSAICNFLQEGASMHAESAGFGFQEMAKRNQVWVLTRLKVIIHRYPLWKENLKLTTWSRGKEGIFYIRDFEIFDGYGKSIAVATSSWAAINTRTRRPEIVDGLEDGLHSFREKKAVEEQLGKLPPSTAPEFVRKREIEYTDIDLVYHVNNVKYIELIINSYNSSVHQERSIRSIEVNYMGEAKYGENVLIYKGLGDESTHVLSVLRESDNREICRARLTWN